MNTEFDEIRPYDDTELPAAVEELIADPDFRDVASRAMPDIPFEELARMMRACRTKSEIQTRVCYKVVERIIERATLGISLDYSALEGDCKPAYTYVSNTRSSPTTATSCSTRPSSPCCSWPGGWTRWRLP